MLPTPVLDDATRARALDLIEAVAARARRVDPFETDVKDELVARLGKWVRRSPQEYWNRYSKASLLQDAEEAAAKRAAGRAPGAAWPTPNSMRGVEPSTPYRLAERLRSKADATE
jgi:hypothetical protein